ncbi:hypothetical protein [Selenomonas sp. AB3002]|uniref:hypothetical protein n=1 Tax=Selenomonas sp. AB3002 TaxID=1392502 RepID=UPI000495B7C6
MKKLVLRFIFMFSVYFLIINVCFAQSVQLSNMGAYNLHERIVSINNSARLNYNISSLDKKSGNVNYYGMAIWKGKNRLQLSLDINENGYVSKIYATSLEPMLVVDDIKNDLTSDEYYRRKYNDVLLNQKHSTYTAERLAQQSTERYQRDRIKKMDGLLYLYGVNGYGRINSLGSKLLLLIGQEINYDNVAKFYGNLYRQSIDVSTAPANAMLTRNICGQLTLIFSALGMSYNECNQMITNSQNGYSSAWCSSLNRRVCVEIRTISGGGTVEISITASDN